MDFLQFLRAVLALVVTLGLIGLVSFGVRRYAPGLLARLQVRAGGAQRRLEVVETLVLGPAQRLLLVRVDGDERLIVLGDGRELEPPAPKASR